MNPIIGLEGLVTAKLHTDTTSALKYHAVEPVVGLVDVQLEDASAEPEALYADNVEKKRITKGAKVKLTVEILAAAHDTLAKFYGHTSSDGVTVKGNTDKPPYRAFGFKADDGGGKQDGIWLKKCVPTKRTNAMTYHTKEGENVTVQTVKLEFEAIPTVKDKEYMRQVNSGNFAGWATYFSAVPGSTPI